MNFLIGSKKTFLDFLEGISFEDKVGIFSHTDLDGLASAVFLSEILKSKNISVDLLEFIDLQKGNMHNKKEILIKNKITKLFISDISADSTDYEGLMKLREEIDVLLIDHHPISGNLEGKDNIIKTDSKDCGAWTIYEFGDGFFQREKWVWLICCTLLAEYSFKNNEYFEFIKKHYPDVQKEDPWGSLIGKLENKISYALTYFKSKKELKKAFEIIKNNKIDDFNKPAKEVEDEIKRYINKIKEEAEFYPEKNLYLYVFNPFPHFSIESSLSSITSNENPDSTFILISQSSANEYLLKISARNQAGIENVNLLVKKGVEGLENATGGGHVKASGGTIMKKDLEEFKRRILE
jgi:single-stranded DNA-specific DHH superfamily exonuclease